MRDVDIKISPMQLVNDVILLSKLFRNDLEDLSDGNRCKVHVGR